MAEAPIRLAAAVFVGFAVAGCSSAAPEYGGMTEYEAGQTAIEAITQDVNQPGNALYRKHPQYVKIVQGENENGEQAWVGVFSLRKSHVCVWVWVGEAVPLNRTYNYSVGKCPPKVLRAKPGSRA